MAELNTEGGGDKKGKHGKQRAKKSSTKIDMTPMVDLAFLLLTFFMLTTTFSKPKVMEINMPIKDDKVEPQKVNNAITVLLSEKDKIYYYYGEFKPGETTLETTNYSKDGLRKLLLEKYNKDTYEKVEKLRAKRDNREIADSTFKRMSVDIKGEKKALMVLVKTDDKAKYRNVIDILDELNICDVGKYALIDISAPEYELVKNFK